MVEGGAHNQPQRGILQACRNGRRAPGLGQSFWPHSLVGALDPARLTGLSGQAGGLFDDDYPLISMPRCGEGSLAHRQYVQELLCNARFQGLLGACSTANLGSVRRVMMGSAGSTVPPNSFLGATFVTTVSSVADGEANPELGEFAHSGCGVAASGV